MHARTMADYKAVSTNLMHGSITVTDSIYARIKDNEVKARIQGLDSNPVLCPDDELQQFISNLSARQLPQALKYIAAQLSNI